MSLREYFLSRHSLLNLQLVISSVIIWFILVAGAFGQQATVKIEKLNLVPFGATVDIPVSLDSVAPDFEMGGFDFLIGYDTAVVTFRSASLGQLLQDCGWEYFTYNTGDSCVGDMCPSGLVRIVALADINNGNIHPSCYGDTAGELFTLTFQITLNHAYECAFTPIQWLWIDCGDNGVSSKFGDSLLMSYDIFDANGLLITYDTTFPTLFGAPDACIDGTLGSGVRAVDFYNGGIELVCPDTGVVLGDLNLNGTPFQPADYYLYADYFLYGLQVFTVNMEQQIATSDVNADGTVLTFPDLIYMNRIMIGDIPPYLSSARQVVDTAVLIQDTVTKKIALDYPDSLSALFINFNGYVVPDDTLTYHEIKFRAASSTSMLVLPKLSNSFFPSFVSGKIFSYTGGGVLVSGEATYDGYSTIPIAIQFGSISCCSNRGNVDGIVGASGPVDVADLSYLVAFLFAGGPNPPCMEEGNVDGVEGPSGLIDINDLTYLVSYLFSGGAPPPNCP